MADYDRVLDFWFGTLDADGLADDDHRARWWRKDPAFDERIRAEFGDTHKAVHAGHRQAWLGSARGRLAYVIVLDQFSRNMFRATPEMFACDAQALEAAREGVACAHDCELVGDERVFLYMPFMHSEKLYEQQECVRLFAGFIDELEGDCREKLASNLKYAKVHRDIVERFGRFPHRNTLLSRDTTDQEGEFLKTPGSSF